MDERIKKLEQTTDSNKSRLDTLNGYLPALKELLDKIETKQDKLADHNNDQDLDIAELQTKQKNNVSKEAFIELRTKTLIYLSIGSLILHTIIGALIFSFIKSFIKPLIGGVQ